MYFTCILILSKKEYFHFLHDNTIIIIMITIIKRKPLHAKPPNDDEISKKVKVSISDKKVKFSPETETV